ncbi:MAG: M1 family aminopeptidase [Pirellulaceae bacterium]
MSRVAWIVAVVLTSSAVSAGSAAAEWSHAELGEGHVCRYCLGHAVGGGFGVELEGTGKRYAPIRHVDIQHIKLDITPNFEQRTVGGNTTIHFSPLREPVRQIKLDAVDLTITDVSGTVEVADFESTKTDLTILFARPIQPDEVAVVTIEHHCQPQGGFYFRTAEMGYPEEDTHCWTQGESHFARQWFPCFDYPNERSTTEVICHVPEDMTVLSNGRLLDESVDAATGLKSVHWKQEKPHVNYLICVVAGYFDKLEKKHRDISLGFYSQPTLAEHAPNAFRDTDLIMDFFEREIGMKYPWNKYDQVTIRDFIAGGMENTTLTTLTHRTIFAAETENIRSARGLDAHELAHQWFGDYVTCEDWSHLWLNEGFATYYTHLYEGEKFGRDAMLYGLYKDATNRILTQANDNRPIVWNEYKNAGDQFDYRAYPKGSWVLHMLRSELGDDLYRRCVQAYLERYALQSVATADLKRTFERVSGRTLDQFFDQWVFHGRFPDVKISYRWMPETKLAKITVVQTHKTDDKVGLFAFPAKFRFHLADQVIDHEVKIDAAKHEIYVPLPAKPTVVRFDPEYTFLAAINFDVPDEMLLAQVKLESDMIGRILAVKQLGKRKTPAAIKALGEVLNGDPFFGVRIAASEALHSAGTDESREVLAKSMKQTDARVRLQVVKDHLASYRPDQVEEKLEIVRKETNPAIQAEGIKALAKYDDPAIHEFLIESLARDSFGQIVSEAAIEAIAATKDANFAQTLMLFVEIEGSDLEARGLGQALVTVGTLLGQGEEKQGGREFLSQYLTDPRTQVQRSAIEALGRLRDPQAMALVESYTAEGTEPSVKRAAEAAVKAISDQTPATTQEVVELRKSVNQLKSQAEQQKKDLQDLKKQLEAVGKQE